jgi:hypothetical protein
MDQNCVPYKRKTLYLALTLPMIGLYIAIAALLLQFGVLYFALYLAFFILVAVFQSYVCVHWQCPYIGKFAPCVGGFCLPSSQLARLWKNVKRTKTRYNIITTLAFANFFAVILFPIYFLYQANILFLLGYLAIVTVYAGAFLLFVCPVCATRQVCPGGQTAMKLSEILPEQLK